MLNWQRSALLIGLLLAATTVSAMPVIFDTDASIDDAMALLVLANSKNVELKAVTVTGTGEAHGEPGANNMAAMLQYLHLNQVPVAYGRATPLSAAGKAFPDSMRISSDRILVGKNIPVPAHAVIQADAVKLMKDTIANSHEKVTILATGPLTNIAEFLTRYPQYHQKIARIVIMGGAVLVPGNINEVLPKANNAVSEWNFYADPLAVQQVFAAHIPITLVALDATNQVPITRQFFNALNRKNKPLQYFSRQLLEDKIKLVGKEVFYRDFYFWDPLAALVLVNPAIAKTKAMELIVDTENGQVRPLQPNEKALATIDVVTKINSPESVRETYIRRLG